MARLEANGYDAPVPEGYCVWRLAPSKYDPDAADGAKGGTLYPCLPSPPMMCTDGRGNCFVSQDMSQTASPRALHLVAQSAYIVSHTRSVSSVPTDTLPRDAPALTCATHLSRAFRCSESTW